MRITFSNNPIDHIQCWLSNKYEDYTQYVWNKKHHRVTCRICGDVLDSNRESKMLEKNLNLINELEFKKYYPSVLNGFLKASKDMQNELIDGDLKNVK